MSDEAKKNAGGSDSLHELVRPLHVEIMDLMIKRSKMDYEYINPNFLAGITELLEGYYQLEDDGVDDWVDGMWSA